MPTLQAPTHDDLGFVPAGAEHADLGFEEAPSSDPAAAMAEFRDKPGHPTIRGLLDMIPGSHKFIARADSLVSGEPYEKKLAETDALYDKEREDPRFRVGQAVTALALPGSSMKGMALLGAAQGAGDARGSFAHTLAGAGLGGVLGAGLNKAGGLASKAVAAAPSFLDKLAIGMGRKALAGGGAISVTKPLSDAAVREALDSGAIKLGGTVGGASERLGNLRAGVGDQYGKIVDSLMAHGVRGPEAETMAERLAAEGRSIASSNTNPAVRSAYDKEALALRAREPAEAAGEEGAFTVARDSEGRLSLRQAENMKRSLQDRATSAYKQLDPSEVGEAHMGVASLYRQANEDAIDQGVRASGDPFSEALGAQFVPVKQRLGNLIEAGNVADQAASRAARNKSLSLTDTIAGAAGLAHGTGGAVMAAGANKLLRTRGPSTAAVALSAASKLAGMAQTQPQALGKFAAPLAQAAARGADAIAATHYTLSQDPAYQALTHALSENDQ